MMRLSRPRDRGLSLLMVVATCLFAASPAWAQGRSGGQQDNNAWCGPSALRSGTGPTNTDWFTVAGGDGFYTRQDPTDWAIVYAESQDGNMVRHDLRNGTQKSIRPNTGGRGGVPESGETQAIMGVSGEKPMASKHDGYAASSLATQIRESPARPGVIWIGTDDGNLQLSLIIGVQSRSELGSEMTGGQNAIHALSHRMISCRSAAHPADIRRHPENLD